MKTNELLLAAELIKRAELLREKDAGAFAAQAIERGEASSVDGPRAQFRRANPYTAYMARALTEMEAAADFIARRSA